MSKFLKSIPTFLYSSKRRKISHFLRYLKWSRFLDWLKTVNFTWITYQWVWIMQINLETWQDFFAEAIVRLCSISVFQHHFFKGKLKTMFSFVIFLFSPSVVIWDFFFVLLQLNLQAQFTAFYFWWSSYVMYACFLIILELAKQEFLCNEFP